MDVLIAGASMAGLTAAYWFARLGHQVTVVERAEGPVVDVAEVAFRPRADGAAITARGIQGVKVGALMAEAVDALGEGVDDDGRAVSVAAGPQVRRSMARAVPASKRGRKGYSDDELRFFADAYRGAPSRNRYEAIRRAYDRDRRWREEAGSLAPDALRYRRTVAHRRIDPATGRPFLEGS